MFARLFLIILFPIALAAQGTMTLTGQITNIETDEALVGANVTVIGTSFGAATSATGTYRAEFPLNRVPADSILLSVTYIGYKSVFMFLPAVTGLTAVDFRMTPKAISLPEVVVKADRVEPTRAYPMVVINREKIDRASTNNVYEMLRIAGVRITGGGGPGRLKNISSRGRSRQPLLVIDGVPIPPTPGGGNDMADILSTMILSNVERIEIVKGQALTYIYGQDAYNGAILIYTRKLPPRQR